jgi:chemotaxis protein MotA
MLFWLSILVALGAVAGSIFHLDQAATTYYDSVAFFVVFGGTLAVTISTLPWENRTEIIYAFRSLMKAPRTQWRMIIEDGIQIIRLKGAPQSAGPLTAQGMARFIYLDGIELISLGFDPETIEVILSERIQQRTERRTKVANAIRGLSKYPPAFGLVGTVLTLVSLMRSIANGATSQQAGVTMAVALVATLYGLLTANLFINPAGERILNRAQFETKEGELALQAILLAARGTPLLQAQEFLNSFVPDNSRVNILNQATDRTARSAA